VAHILVTGSADGIGLQTARTLLESGGRVVLHARSEQRAEEVWKAVPEAAGVVVGDVSSLAGTRALAEQASRADPFDVVIHNVGVGGGVPERTVTEDGLERIFQVNVLAPYLLTALLPRPARLVYLTSGLQAQGTADLDDLQFERRRWDGMQAYSDSKLYDVALALAVARRWPDVISNAVDPGWIRTRMGGPGATDSLAEGAETQIWLATSDRPDAVASGRYLRRRRVMSAHPAALDPAVQERLLAECARLTGVALPD
jgi:NAD(P)-dependent dehydrogenase (short-subunit alcohol dehydrogenase family)